jgi:RNA-directed DNA polymerase
MRQYRVCCGSTSGDGLQHVKSLRIYALVEGDPSDAYNANMDNGNINNDGKSNDNNNAARCVRPENGDLFGFQNLLKCYLACRRGKRRAINSLRFEENLEMNLLALEQELKNRSYKPRRSVCFTVLKPKPREIFAADFRDRVVHHLLVGYLEEIFEPKFIFDSWACRRGKGTHAAVSRLRKFTRKATSNGAVRAYFLQLDVHNFFMSIDKKILYGLIEKHVSDGDILWLAWTVLFNEPAENYVQKSPPRIRCRVPPHKSLLNVPRGLGLPIGNYTSQFFANIYLSELDQFVKHKLKCRLYLRYVDDFILLSQDRGELEYYKTEIEKFLITRLQLRLKPGGKLAPISNGIDFLGYVTRPGYVLVRNRVARNFREKLDEYRVLLAEDKSVFGEVNPMLVCRLQATVNSYLGHFKHANAFHLKQNILREHKWLNRCLKFKGAMAKTARTPIT